jgi:hypothetical protein
LRDQEIDREVDRILIGSLRLTNQLANSLVFSTSQLMGSDIPYVEYMRHHFRDPGPKTPRGAGNPELFAR